MNLEIGRFTTMDVVDGSPNQPITQNKYLYANADPISKTDPTGYFSLVSLGEFGASGAVSSVLAQSDVRIGTQSLLRNLP